MIIDSHCHLTAPAYEGALDPVLTRALEAGVGVVISVASNLDDAEEIGKLVEASRAEGAADRWPAVFGTAGIHPHEVGTLPTDPAGREDILARLRERLGGTGTVALGECGLDYHYDFAPREVQREWFRRQLEVAGDLGLPAVVHCREAEADIAAMVREAGEEGVVGVLHCFPGDMALLGAALEAGWSVSFTGIVTFRNYGGESAVREVPGDRYFLETDGPYLAPVPHRGRRNEPAHTRLIARRVAELRGESAEEVIAHSTRNARRLFRLPAG